MSAKFNILNTDKSVNAKPDDKRVKEYLKKIPVPNQPFQFANDVKKSIEFNDIFNCDSLKNFTNSIIKELHWTGFSGSRFVRCKSRLENDPKIFVVYTVKIAFYNKTIPEIYETQSDKKITAKHTNMTDCEIQILDIFNKEFIQTNVSRHIIWMFHAKKCDTLSKLAPSDQFCLRAYDTNYAQLYNQPENLNSVQNTLCQQKASAAKGISYDSVAFIALEKIDTTLKLFLEKYIDNQYNIIIVKSLLFMLVYTLFKIKEKYPLFQHNDLHPGNITLHFEPKYDNKNFRNLSYNVYHARGNVFYIPYLGISPSIVDFGFSSLPEHNIINAIELDPRRVPSFNEDNDMCLLFNKISTLLPKDTNPILHKLLDDIDARQTYKIYNREYLRGHTEKITTIDDMMAASIWDEYLEKIPKKQINLEFK
jgi:hypothetical protein